MSNTADPHIAEEGFGVLAQMSERVALWTNDVDIFPKIYRPGICLVLAYAKFCTGPAVDCRAWTSKTTSFFIAGVWGDDLLVLQTCVRA